MKRDFIGYLAVHSGVAKVLRSIWHDQLTVLAYHRIGGTESTFDALFDDSLYSCTQQALEQQLLMLKRVRTIVTLNDVCDALDGKLKLPPRAALVTFDDATQDHYTRAFPVLRRHQINGLFFVSTRSLTERTVEWWNLLTIAIKRAAAGTYDLGELGGIVTLHDAASRVAVARSVSDKIKSHSVRGDALPLVQDIAARLDIALPAIEQQSDGVITPAQLIEMQRAGMTIGSHSHSHAFLNRLRPQEQLQELQQSKAILENLLQVPVRSIAYPYGQATDYDQHSRDAAKLAGYDCAFNLLKRRLVDPSKVDRYDIDRFPVPAQADFRFEASISGITVS